MAEEDKVETGAEIDAAEDKALDAVNAGEEIDDANDDLEDGATMEEVTAAGAAAGRDFDPLLDAATLDPIVEQREKSLKELLQSMDEFAPIIPDAVTDYYLARSGFKTQDHRIKRLLALATQKFVSDIAHDAYQFSRIRAQSGPGAAGTQGRARAGGSGKTVLTMEDLSNVLTEYGINARRPDFYR